MDHRLEDFRVWTRRWRRLREGGLIDLHLRAGLDRNLGQLGRDVLSLLLRFLLPSILLRRFELDVVVSSLALMLDEGALVRDGLDATSTTLDRGTLNQCLISRCMRASRA
jgi:hypothetical protein